MNAEPIQPVSSATAASPAQARGSAVPVGLFVLMALLLYWGAIYFDAHGGWFNPQIYTPYTSVDELNEYVIAPGANVEGKRVFDTICALCHGPDGAGKPGTAPPLAGSEWAQGSPNRMIRIPLVGLNGPITVKGQQYNLSMAAMGAALSPEDLAAVLTYIRSSFGNKASAITPEQVSAIKTELKNHPQPYTADELKALPE